MAQVTSEYNVEFSCLQAQACKLIHCLTYTFLNQGIHHWNRPSFNSIRQSATGSQLFSHCVVILEKPLQFCEVVIEQLSIITANGAFEILQCILLKMVHIHKVTTWVFQHVVSKLKGKSFILFPRLTMVAEL